MFQMIAGQGGQSPASARHALESIRKHLGMEVAYISKFEGDRSVFIEVDAPGLEHMIKPGDSRALDDVYCRHILAGNLPEMMADTADYELARSMPITAAVPIGAHVSVPIRSEDGSVLGMFCCLSPIPNKSLNDRDLQVMRVFADIAGQQITSDMDARRLADDKRQRIASLMSQKSFGFAFQPIWDFRASKPTGFEVLCRFTPQPYRSPDKWFHDAFDVGLGIELEIAVLAGALEQLVAFPQDVFLSINSSPDTILGGHLEALLEGYDLSRIVLEITEHAPVADYDLLLGKLAALRAQGLRLAIDDAGAGYSSLQHIVQLQPDIIKLDMSLTRAVDIDPARRALASALIFFARETGSLMVAEGIETATELETLRLLGVPKGQGYFLGRPLDRMAAQALLQETALAKAG